MRPRGLRTATALAVVTVVAAAAAPALAQPADVAAQIKLIDTQPAGMDRATWKDRRRDAARKLGQSKDPRAVGVLIRLAETETFDIIGEIAIEGLGNLGDPAAVPVLQRILGDPSRDKAQKDLARKALARLGADARASGGSSGASAAGGTGATGGPGATGTATAAGAASGTGAPGSGASATGAHGTGRAAPVSASRAAPASGDTGRAAPASGDTGGPGSALLGTGAPSAVPERAALPAIDDDAIAAYERVTFAGGTANAGYDTVRKRLDLDADVAGQ